MVTQLSQEEGRALAAFLRGLDEFFTEDPYMSIAKVRTFVLVALKEGSGVLELASETAIGNSLMSRYLGDLGEVDRYKEPGLNWIYQKTDVRDRRSHKAYLTSTGVSRRHALLRALHQ